MTSIEDKVYSIAAHIKENTVSSTLQELTESSYQNIDNDMKTTYLELSLSNLSNIEKSGDLDNLHNVYFDIATLNILTNNNESIIYYMKALNISLYLKYDKETAQNLLQIARLNIILGNFHDAIKFYNQCLDIISKIDNPTISKLMIYRRLAEIYTIIGNVIKAKEFSNKLGINLDMMADNGSCSSIENVSINQNSYSKILGEWGDHLPEIDVSDLTDLELEETYSRPHISEQDQQVIFSGISFEDILNLSSDNSSNTKYYKELLKLAENHGFDEFKQEIKSRLDYLHTIDNKYEGAIGQLEALVDSTTGEGQISLISSNLQENVIEPLPEMSLLQNLQELLEWGIECMDHKNYQNAVHYFKKALDISNINNIPLIDEIHYFLAVSLTNIGELPSAMKHQLKYLSMMENSGNRKNEGKSLLNLMDIYAKIGRFFQALSYAVRYYGLSKELKDTIAEKKAIENIMMLRYELNQPKITEQEIAFHYLGIGPENTIGSTIMCREKKNDMLLVPLIEIQDDTTKTRRLIWECQNREAIRQFGLMKTTQTIEIHKLNLESARKLNDIACEAESLKNLGICSKQNSIDSALIYFIEYLGVAKKISDKLLISVALYYLQILTDEKSFTWDNIEKCREIRKLATKDWNERQRIIGENVSNILETGDESRSIYLKRFQEALNIFEEIRKSAKNMENIELEYNALINLAEIHESIHSWHKAIYYYKNAYYTICQLPKYRMSQNRILFRLYVINRQICNYEAAFIYLKDHLYFVSGNYIRQSIALESILDLCLLMRNTHYSALYCEKYRQISEKLQDSIGIARAETIALKIEELMMANKTHVENQSNQLSVSTTNEASCINNAVITVEKSAITLSDHYSYALKCHLDNAEVNIVAEQFDQAVKNYRKAISIIKNHGKCVKYLEPFIYYNLVVACNLIGDADEKMWYKKAFIKYFNENVGNVSPGKIYLKLFELSMTIGEYNEAITNAQIYQNLSFNEGNYEERSKIENLIERLKIFLKSIPDKDNLLDERRRIWRIRNQYGMKFWGHKHFAKAINAHEMNVEFAQNANLYEEKMKSAFYLGLCYKETYQYCNAIDSFKFVLIYARNIKNNNLIKIVLFLLYDSYHNSVSDLNVQTGICNLSELENAVNNEKIYLNERIDHFLATKNDSVTREEALEEYITKEKSQDQILVYEIIIEEAINSNSPALEIRMQMEIGKIYMDLKMWVDSIRHYKIAHEIAIKKKKLSLKADTAYKLYEIYSNLDDYKAAANNLRTYAVTKQRITKKAYHKTLFVSLSNQFEKLRKFHTAHLYAEKHYKLIEKSNDKSDLAAAESNCYRIKKILESKYQRKKRV